MKICIEKSYLYTNFLAKEQIKRWFKKFKSGDIILADEERKRPSNFDDQAFLTFTDCFFIKKFVEIAK